MGITKYFNKLPVRYQQALNTAVLEVDGGEDPRLATAWKEYEAEIILESKLDALNLKTTKETADGDYSTFCDGWKAGKAEAIHEMLNQKPR